MCGIAGIGASAGHQVNPVHLCDMIAMLSHRGPDASGLHVEPSVGLAHARLSIIDRAGGQQPMSNDDGSIWIAFNGEAFNFIELRNELIRQGCRFQTRSDTEVILRAYELEGEQAVHRLNGQWALAIWDRRSETLFLSRDRLGVRPLYYTRRPEGLLFASEIKALFAYPGVPRELDPEGLDNILTFWTTLAPRTAFRGIHELPPGHSLTWRRGEIRITRHWQMQYPLTESPAPERSVEAHLEMVRTRLTEATRLRLRADVPVGAYLSGGLDSSLIAALICELGHRPQTFSIAFDDHRVDERLHQRAVASALGTDHHELRCSNDDIAQVFPDVIWHAESPLLRTAPAPMFLLSKFARDNGHKVVLTGEGADETFGGYDIFKEAKVRRYIAQNPASPRRPLLLGRLYPYMHDLHRQSPAYLQAFFHATGRDLASPFFSHMPRWAMTSRLKMFLSDDFRAAVGNYDGYGELASRLPAEYPRWDPLCQAQYLEASYLLPGYILSSQGDRMAMAHSVEGRHPFLDPDVVACGAALPARLKMKVLEEKHVLKTLARDLLPASIWRRPKQPYRAPDASLFFGEQPPEYVKALLAPSNIRKSGVFNPDAVDRLVRKFESKKAIGHRDTMALTAILSTELLVDRFVTHFGKVSHGHAHARLAAVYR